MVRKAGVKKVMVFGTFDIIHPGHIHFIKQAKRLGDYLIVSIARDTNVKKFKGEKPVFNENERLAIMQGLKEVDKAVLGGGSSYLEHILKESPHIIALGYDQTAYYDELVADIKSGKLFVEVLRLKPHKPHIYKSGKIKKKIKNF